MDKKDFIFPGVILGIVIIVGIGLLITHGQRPALIPADAAATSTGSSAAGDGMATSSGGMNGSAGMPAGMPAQDSAVSSGPSAYYPYGTFTLSLNQPAQFKDGVSIRPLSVTEDSRCPADVECIQAGTVTLSLKANAGGTAKTVSLSLGKTVMLGNDMLTLSSVLPARAKTGAIAPSAYRFTFSVSPM